MEVGDRVLAVGAPFGLAGTVTSGIISAKGRNLHMNMYEDFLQTDAAINPGNSGGPLISMDGKVIGINSAIKSRSGGFQGVGLAVASNLAKNIKDALENNGAVHRGYLGIGIDEIDSDDLAAHLGVKDGHGVIVTRVFDGRAGGARPASRPATWSRPWAASRSRTCGLCKRWWPCCPRASRSSWRWSATARPETLSVTIDEQPPDFGTEKAARAADAGQLQEHGRAGQDRGRGRGPDAEAGRRPGLQGRRQGRPADGRGPRRRGRAGRPGPRRRW